MKKVKVRYDGNVKYLTSSTMFSIIDPPKDNVFKQSGYWTSCRETLTGWISEQYNLTAKKGYSLFFKLRVAIYFCKEATHNKNRDFNRNMEDAARFLNLIETRLGWTKTSAYKAANSPEGFPTKVYVFNSSAKWARSTQLLSLYLLCIRLGRVEGFLSEITSLDALAETAKALDLTKYQNSVSRGDLRTFKNTAKYWMLMLDNCEELFFGSTMKYNLSQSRDTEGITKLFQPNLNYCSDLMKATRSCWQKIKSDAEKMVIKAGIKE